MDSDLAFKPGDTIEKEEEFIVYPGGQVGHTIDFVGDDGISFEVIIVWDDARLRDRIVELLNKYGVENA